MNRLEAHARFDRRGDDRSILPADAEVGGCDCWPAVATSAAELSGRLDECQSDGDLDDAVRHFFTLLDIGVCDEDQLRDGAWDVLSTLEQWGNEVEQSAAWN